MVVSAFAVGFIYAGFQNLNSTQNEILKELDSKADKTDLELIDVRIEEKIKILGHVDELTHDLDKRVYHIENK